MSDLRTAAQQALEALEFMADEWGFTQKANRPERWQAIDALRAALAEEALQRLTDVNQEIEAALKEPEQEPVAWMVYTQDGKSVCVTDNPADFIEWRSFPLYTHPSRREWRGLTDEQLLYVYNELPNWGMDMDSLSPKLKQFAHAIEAALKERNA